MVSMALPTAALAHDGASAPATWHFAASLALALALSAVLCGTGALRQQRKRGERRPLTPTKVVSMGAGLVVLVLTLISPLHALADRLISAHMLQHFLLMLVAAPLLVWGGTTTILMWSLPGPVRSAIGQLRMTRHFGFVAGIVRRPAVAWVAFSGSIAFWHLPPIYRMTLGDEGLHALMHLTFFGAGLLFWSVVLEPSGKRRLDYGRTILLVFSTAMITGLAGALLSFAQKPIYHPSDGPAVLGLTPLEDQRVAGLIMWIPMDFVLFCVSAALFTLWLSRTGRRPLVAGGSEVTTPLVFSILMLLCGCGQSGAPSQADAAEQANRGKSLIVQHGCGSCHEIPGIRSADGVVGPPLDRFGRRIYIAGMLRNSPGNLVMWLRNPQAVVPGNAMPDMNITESDAREIAAYLLALE